MRKKYIAIVFVTLFGIWSATSASVADSTKKSKPKKEKIEAIKPGTKIVLFDGKTLDGWIQVPANSWEVKDSAMASKGAGRGYI